MGPVKILPLKGIRRRWLINSLSTALMIVIVSLSAFAVVISNYFYTTIRDTVENKAKTTADFFDRFYNDSYETYYGSAYRWAEEFKERDKLELQFINTYGRIEITTAGPNTGLIPGTPDVEEALTQVRMRSWVGEDPLTGERVLSVSHPLLYMGNEVIGVIRYVSSMKLADREILRMFGVAALIGTIFIIIVVITNLIFIRGIIFSIEEINEFTKRIAEGCYGIRIEKSYDDEIGELVDNINHMSSEISAAERMKTDFMSSVSHELRTPLTAINGWGETLLSADAANPEEIKRGVQIILKETARLTQMVEELLDFTRIEGGRMTLHLENIDISSVIEEVVYMYMSTAQRQNIQLNFDMNEDIPTIMGDKDRLKQVFINLLDNAAKHGGDGKKIDVNLFFEEPWAVISFKDYGVGISPEELPHIKYMFYKASQKSRGYGIGLAVSDEIIRLHNGLLDIKSELNAGTCVFVKLPVSAAV